MAIEKTFHSMDLSLETIVQPLSSLEMHTPTASSKQTANTVEEEKPFRLMDLAPELVLKILEHAVVYSTKDKPISVTKAVCTRTKASALVQSGRKYRAASVRLLQPAIIRSCRMLREEGLKLFYTGNIFLWQWNSSSYSSSVNFSDWLHSIGAANASMMRQLYVENARRIVLDVRAMEHKLRVQLKDGPLESLCTNISGHMCFEIGILTKKSEADTGYLLQEDWERKWRWQSGDCRHYVPNFS